MMLMFKPFFANLRFVRPVLYSSTETQDGSGLASGMVVCRTASSKPTEKVFHRSVTEMNLSSICWVGGAGLEFKSGPNTGYRKDMER